MTTVCSNGHFEQVHILEKRPVKWAFSQKARYLKLVELCRVIVQAPVPFLGSSGTSVGNPKM